MGITVTAVAMESAAVFSPGIIIAMMAISIPILAIVLGFVKDMVKTRVKSLAHQENIERMKNGYLPLEVNEKGKKAGNDIVVDLTVDQEWESRAN